MLWYNKTLLDQFGYPLPTTWEEYQALGEKVAQEHPGYIVGTVGDAWTPEVYFWGSKCQANDITGPRRGHASNTDQPRVHSAPRRCSTRCSRTAPSPNVSVFTPEFVQKYTGKVLMMPGPAWYAGAIFNNPQSLNVPAGQLGVARPAALAGRGPR